MRVADPQQRLRSLKTQAEAGARLKFVLFRHHEPRAAGALDESCLSQWYGAPFSCGGTTYATAEHYMMAAKAALFRAPAIRQQILDAPSPGAARALGGQVPGFHQRKWDEAKYGVVVAANMLKFGQSDQLREFLLKTGDKVLAEASRSDRIWGIGLAPADPGADDPRQWRGLNLLGFALMEVRDRIAQGEQPAGLRKKGTSR